MSLHVAAIENADEYREAMLVIAKAWRAAFDDIVSSEALSEVDRLAADDIGGRFEAVHRMQDGFGLVARTDGDVIGVSLVAWAPDWTEPYVESDEAHLRSLYVTPEDWGNGVGTRLLEASIDRLPSTVSAIKLETFRDNEGGRAFYESRGFSHVGAADFEIAGDAYPTVVYAKDL